MRRRVRTAALALGLLVGLAGAALPAAAAASPPTNGGNGGGSSGQCTGSAHDRPSGCHTSK